MDRWVGRPVGEVREARLRLRAPKRRRQLRRLRVQVQRLSNGSLTALCASCAAYVSKYKACLGGQRMLERAAGTTA